MKTLGLDVSSISTGYCIFNNGRLIKSTCGLIQPNPKKIYGERLYTFETELKAVIKEHKPDEVIIENIFKGRNILTFKSLAMFRAIAIKTIFEDLGLDVIELMASEARSVVGIKNDKEVAYNFIVKKYKLVDYEFSSHNDITDSILLGLSAQIMRKQGIDPLSLKKKRKKKKRKKRKYGQKRKK